MEFVKNATENKISPVKRSDSVESFSDSWSVDEEPRPYQTPRKCYEKSRPTNPNLEQAPRRKVSCGKMPASTSQFVQLNVYIVERSNIHFDNLREVPLDKDVKWSSPGR